MCGDKACSYILRMLRDGLGSFGLAWQTLFNLNSSLSQQSLRANATPLKNLRSPNDPSSENDLFIALMTAGGVLSLC